MDVADHLGHTDIAFTSSVYRRTLSRKDGERARLRVHVTGPDAPQDERGASVGAATEA